jgi:hypothetical protein
MTVEIVNGADGGPLFKLYAETPTDSQFINSLNHQVVICEADDVKQPKTLSVRSIRNEG